MLFGSARPRRQHASNYFPLPLPGLSFACAHLWIAIESHFQTLMPAFSFQLLYPSASKSSVKRRPQKHTSFFCVLSFSTQKLIPHTAFYVPRYPAKAPKVFSAKKKRTRQVFLPPGIFRWVSLFAKFRKCPAPAQSAPVHNFCRLAVLPAAAYVPPVHVPVPAYHRRFLFPDM